MSLLRKAIPNIEERKVQEEEREAIRSTFRGALFRGTAASIGTGLSGFFAYVHLNAANVMGADATNNYIVGALFATTVPLFLAYALHNFKDLQQAKRP